MNGELMFALIIIITIGTIIAAVILFNNASRIGKDSNKGLALTRAGWIVVAIYSALIIAGVIYLCIETSFWVVLLIVVLPLAVVIGLICTLACGIYYLVTGYKNKKDVDKKKVRLGMICLIINASIVLAIGVLIIIFMSGLIPIRLM